MLHVGQTPSGDVQRLALDPRHQQGRAGVGEDRRELGGIEALTDREHERGPPRARGVHRLEHLTVGELDAKRARAPRRRRRRDRLGRSDRRAALVEQGADVGAEILVGHAGAGIGRHRVAPP